MPNFKIGERTIGDGHPVYFIADIAANHDGSLMRAKRLIAMAAESGANAAKFQHFRASKIVSDLGFRELGGRQSHQAKWRRPVYEVYEEASLPWEWTPELKACCREARIDFLSTPYDFEAANMLDAYVEGYKIGSGDITWLELVKHIAEKRKPLILSTGASTMPEVRRAVDAVSTLNPSLALLQCNTNYSGAAESFDHIHLRVLQTYHSSFGHAVLGLSDHTPGHAVVLGAVALGAKIIEKHFTDDVTREGPDHGFSMTPATWQEMVERTRELERALGETEKIVAGNEKETVVLQRRCLRAARDLRAGHRIERCDVDVLRPAPIGAIFPYEISQVVGRRLLEPISRGETFQWATLETVMVDDGPLGEFASAGAASPLVPGRLA